MKIFEPVGLEGYQWVVLVEEADFELFRSLGGSGRAGSWAPIPVRLIEKDEFGRPLLESDFPWLGSHTLVLGKRAVEAIGPRLADDGELLPLACDAAPLWALNAWYLLDALDEERSNIVRFAATGGVMTVESYAFRPDVVDDFQLFTIPQLRRSQLFVGQRLVDWVGASSLRGLGFRELWRSD